MGSHPHLRKTISLASEPYRHHFKPIKGPPLYRTIGPCGRPPSPKGKGRRSLPTTDNITIDIDLPTGATNL